MRSVDWGEDVVFVMNSNAHAHFRAYLRARIQPNLPVDVKILQSGPAENKRDRQVESDLLDIVI